MISPALYGQRAVLTRRMSIAAPLRHHHYNVLKQSPSGFWSFDAQLKSSAVPKYPIQRRYASSRPSPKHSRPSPKHSRPSSSAEPKHSSSTPSTSSTATTAPSNDINPPLSTLPADINIPEPVSPSASPSDKLKRYIALGRAYVSFYKTGVKNVYHNYRAAIPIRRSLGINAYAPTSIPPTPPAPQFHESLTAVNLNRAKFQLLRRSAHDIRRMIPFTFLLIICGEFTPLVVLALGDAITPFTCRVPQQVAKTRSQRSARKRAALAAHQAQTTGSVTPVPIGSDQELDLLAKKYASLEWVEDASPTEVLRACAVFNLVKTHNRSPGLVSVLYKPRLRRFAEYLKLDDELIRNGGGVKALSAAEVRFAVDERGGVDVSEGQTGWDAERVQRRWLERWLQRRK